MSAQLADRLVVAPSGLDLPKVTLVPAKTAPLSQWNIHCGFLTSLYHNCSLSEIPSRSSLLQNLFGELTSAFKGCTSLQVRVLDPECPIVSRAGGCMDADLIEGYLILKQTDSEDGVAMRIVYLLLSEMVSHSGEFEVELTGDEVPVEKQISDHKRSNRFAPSVTLEFGGANWLRVEVDARHGLVVFRTKEKWSGFKIPQFLAGSLVSYAARICDIETEVAKTP